MKKNQIISLIKKPISIILIVYSLYALLYIWRTSFIINGMRFFSLCDDAMISLQYAKNLAHGDGFKWFAGGSAVEGITNPGWALVLTIPFFLGTPLHIAPLVVQIISLTCNLLTLTFLYKYINERFQTKAGLLATLLTAFYLPFSQWSLQGLEIGIIQAITLIYLYASTRYKFCTIFLGTLIFFRMDTILLAFFLLLISFNPKELKPFIYGTISILSSVTLLTIFRLSYYGDIFPNTYYLKTTGFPLTSRIFRGMKVFLSWLHSLGFVLILPLAYINQAKKDKHLVIIALIVITQCAYSIFVGGDAWEWDLQCNRYISTIWPLFSIFIALGFVTAFNRLSRHTATSMILLIIITINSPYNYRQDLSKLLLISQTSHWNFNKIVTEESLIMSKIINKNTSIATVWAGIPSYYNNCILIDSLGKNDLHIARILSRKEMGEFYPGHMKFDWDYIFNKNPDIIFQDWHMSDSERSKRKKFYYNIIHNGIPSSIWINKNNNNINTDYLNKKNNLEISFQNESHE